MMDKMEEMKEKRKLGGGIWKKTWERCKSFSNTSQHTKKLNPSISKSLSHVASSSNHHVMAKSKSWSSSLLPRTPSTPRAYKRSGSIKAGVSTPKGCLSVYVGSEKERFVIKVKCTNHPLFMMLLEDAEKEYGFHNEGPIVLPCDVDMFIKVLFEMDNANNNDDLMVGGWDCSLSPRTSYHPLTPPSSSTSLIRLF